MATTKQAQASILGSYLSGFALSVLLTLATYILVTRRSEFAGVSTKFIAIAIIVFAIVQFLVQMVFFLHIGRGPKTRSTAIMALFMVVVVMILVIGSVWIMVNLGYSHSSGELDSPKQTDLYIIKDEGF